MANIKVSASLKSVKDNLEKGMSEMNKTLGLQIFRALTLIEKKIKDNIKKAGLQRRTGRLLNVWGENKTVDVSGNTATGTISSKGVPYAAIHEFGGKIRSQGKKLSIPLSPNRRADGAPKITLKELFGGLGSRVFITKNGVVMLATQAKKNKFTKMTPMFVFKDEVTIPARPYIRPAIEESKNIILKNFGLFIASAFSKSSGSESDG